MADRRGFRHMKVGIVGTEDLVGRTELGSEMEKDRRSLAGVDSLVVVGSLVEEGHRMLVGEEEGCWRSLEQGDIADLLERSWAEEGIGVDHNPVGRIAAEGGDHPDVGHRRSNRCLTL